MIVRFLTSLGPDAGSVSKGLQTLARKMANCVRSCLVRSGVSKGQLFDPMSAACGRSSTRLNFNTKRPDWICSYGDYAVRVNRGPTLASVSQSVSRHRCELGVREQI